MGNYRNAGAKDITLFLAVAALSLTCVGQWWTSRNLAVENSQQQRILIHHTKTIYKKNQKIKELEKLNEEANKKLDTENNKNNELAKENASLKGAVDESHSTNKILVESYQKTVVDLTTAAQKNHRPSVWLTYVIGKREAEIFAAKIVGLLVKAQLSQAVNSAISKEKLRKCGEVIVKLTAGDREIVQKAIRAIPHKDNLTYGAEAANKAFQIFSASVALKNQKRENNCSL